MSHGRPTSATQFQTQLLQATNFLQKRSPWLSWSLLSACLLILAISCLRPAFDFDSFWHLKTGMDWVEQGLSPLRDHYSYTFYGEPVKAPWAFQLIYYALFRGFGFDGGQIAYKLVALSAVLFAMGAWLKRVRAPNLVTLLVLPALVVALQFRAQLRPELISYVLMMAAFFIAHRAESRMTVRRMLPVVLLMTLWTNIHGAVLGYVIFLGLFIDIAARLFRDRAPAQAWGRWLGWGSATVAVGFLNVHLSHPIIEILTLSPELKALIQEYSAPLIFTKIYSVYLIGALGLFTLFLCLRQRRIGYLVVFLVFLYSALTTERMVTPGIIVTLAIFTHVMTLAVTEPGRTARPAAIQMVTLAFVTTALVVFGGRAILVADAFVKERRTGQSEFPLGMVRHMRENALSGDIFNEYQMGGFLLYHLAPDNAVYIDGRTGILYSAEHASRFFAMKRSLPLLTAELDRYETDLVVLSATRVNAELMSQAGFRLEYVDSHYALFQRHAGQLDMLGTLWALPFCFPRLSEEALARLGREAAIPSIGNSYLAPLSALVEAALDADAFATRLPNVDGRRLPSDPAKRLHIVLAMEAGHYRQALTTLYDIRAFEFRDLLVQAMAFMGLQDLDSAQLALTRSIRQAPAEVGRPALILQHALLSEFLAAPGALLDPAELAYYDRLTALLGDDTLQPGENGQSTAVLCPGNVLANSDDNRNE